MYNKLVLSGGAKRGMLTLGSLEYIYENFPNHLSNINSYIGCSVGTIINYHLILGYTPTEILTTFITKDLISNFKNIDLVKLSSGNGAYSWDCIHTYLNEITLSKYDNHFTLKELYDTFNKEFVCISYNYSKQQEEILSHTTHPDLSCIDAIHMSTCIPLFFDSFKYKDNIFIDGAFSNSFPINLLNDYDKALAINVSKMFITTKPNQKITTYIYNLLCLVVVNNVKHNFKKHSNPNTKIINIVGKDISTNGLHGNITDILNIFSYGYNYTKTIYNET
jgi:predicted acylesterase/phospholipase RssA